jgi:osmotically-inducible protein OsmY
LQICGPGIDLAQGLGGHIPVLYSNADAGMRDVVTHRGDKPWKGMSMSNVLLRQNIIDELDFDPSINSANIGVAVENGVVTLSGHVLSYAEKLAAEKAVRRVKGVQAIAEEIKVRYPSDKKTADDEIAARALNILKWSDVVPQNSVQLKVQDGWVNLSGQVDWQFQRIAAESQIRLLSGVAGVVNSIAVKPRVQTTDVKRRIEDALKRNAQIDAQQIRVSVLDGGKVALDGNVHDWRERDAAQWAAWSAAGVIGVENHLKIS